ncbi:MAG: AarF/ABC1/UbiB kinase family protein [Opitutales bacterium]|nr:AarF/ABC1/UbiB kinase family protein [Opitutales bacterium]
MKPLSLIRDAVRAKEILTVLVRYGFSNLLEQVNAPTGWISKIVQREQVPFNIWQRIRMVCEDLGPTAVKLGQLLSTQPDVIPEPLIEEFKLLQHRVNPLPFSDIHNVLEEELGTKLGTLFSEIEGVSIGSGSIAQVHRARIRETGQWVALKIQRPGVIKALRTDLDILSWLAREVHEHVEHLRPYNLPSVVDMLKNAILRETDFTIEANNTRNFNQSNPYKEWVFAPKVYLEWSSSRLLVTDYIEGKSPSHIEEIDTGNRARLATHGGISVFHQIIIKGFFHADPHPGNIIITPEGKICLIDWGLVGQLTRHMRYALADMLTALKSKDAERITRVALSMGKDAKPLDNDHLEMQVARVMARYPDLDVGKIGKVIMELIHVLGVNGISLSRDYTLLAKSILSIEQTGNALDPEFDIGAVAKPFLEQLAFERINPLLRWKEVVRNLHNGIFKLNELPADINRLIHRIERGEITVNMQHTGLEKLSETLNSTSNRLMLAIIIGSLIIGSSMIITTGVAPLFLGFPVIGIVGYLLSIFLGLWIVFDILRHGRHK